MRWSRGTGPALATGLAALVAQILAMPVLAATPAPTAGIGDARSPGQGAGLVGDPLLAIVVVAGIAILSLVATLVYVRATGGSRSGSRPPR